MTNRVQPRESNSVRLRPASQRVLGVDTSLRSTGFGVVDALGNSFSGVVWGLIRNPASRPHTACLAHLFKELQRIVEETRPTAVAVEGVFFSKNVRTAVILGQARGVVLAACALANLPVYEYSPRSVKQAVVGNGNAHKDQVGRMVGRLLSVTETLADDAADALALAICHLHQARIPELAKAAARL